MIKTFKMQKILTNIYSSNFFKNTIVFKMFRYNGITLFCLLSLLISFCAEAHSKSLKSHYQNIGSEYDSMIFYSDPKKLDWNINQTIEALDIKKDDIVSDIGGGSGLLAFKLYDKVKLKHKVFNVDPHSAILSQSKKYPDSINPILMDSNQFIKSSYAKKSSVFLIKEAIHHFNNLQEFLDNLSDLVKFDQNKRILITTRCKISSLNLFKKATQMFESHSIDSYLALRIMLLNSNLNPEISLNSFTQEIQKNNFFSMIKKRFLSTLSNFSDEELHDGIKELEKKFSNTKKIKLKDDFLFIKISHNNNEKINIGEFQFHKNSRRQIKFRFFNTFFNDHQFE